MSRRSFTSGDWHRVAALRLRLRSNAGITRQSFRGGLWYVLHDKGSGQFHRFSPEAWFFITLLDGNRTVGEAWDIACARLGDDAMVQSDVLRLLGQLHAADVLRGDVMPDIDEMLHQAARRRRRKRLMSMMNPLALKLPLIDPDEFLTATMPLVRPLLSGIGAILYLALIAVGLVLLGLNWGPLTENIADRVLAADSLVLILLTYPLVKTLHELGHGYAVKRWGGEVHEMGVMLLVFLPVPYVDASAATRFTSKWQRALVGGAGILVELGLAAIALIVWTQVEDGLVRAFAFNVMLIGGVSTVLFNGNPLLRFDGYFVLADVIEIPNLGQRSNRYLGYLVQRYAFGIGNADSPVTARGERKWLASYSVLAFLYRLTVVMAIVLFVANAFPFVGAILAIWSIVLMLGVPIGMGVWFLLTSPKLRRKRGRAFAVTGSTLAAIGLGLGFVPLPHATVAESVVWTPGEAGVHAGQSGEVAEILARPNQRVAAGAPLMRLADPALDARIAAMQSRVRALEFRLEAMQIADRAEARVLETHLERAREDLAFAERASADLWILSPGDGRLVMPFAEDLPGTWVTKGARVGHVVDFSDPVLVAVVPEASADIVRSQTERVEVRFVHRMSEVIPARIRREVPQLSSDVPMTALTTEGGGWLSRSPGGTALQVLDRVLQLEVEFDDRQEVSAAGMRAYVRFRHPDLPIATRLWRGVRQLFLREFDV